MVSGLVLSDKQIRFAEVKTKNPSETDSHQEKQRRSELTNYRHFAGIATSDL